jgi:hypothetical protein
MGLIFYQYWKKVLKKRRIECQNNLTPEIRRMMKIEKNVKM